MQNARSIRREQVAASPSTVLVPASLFKPSVRCVELDGTARIFKDVRPLPPGARALARLLLGHERRVVERLQGLEGVPQVVARIDRDGMLMSFLPGAPMKAGHTPGGIRQIVDRLLGLLTQLEARGVYHLDLRHKRNLVIDEAGNVGLVDFGAALALGPRARRWLGPALARFSRRAALKYLLRWAPEEMTDTERDELRRFRRLRRAWVFSAHRPPAGEEARL